MNLRAMRIGTRLGIGFAVILALLTVVVAVSTLLVTQNKNALKKGLEVANLKGELVADMKSALLQSGVAMRNMLDISTVDQQKARVDAQNKLYAEAHAKLVSMPLTDAEKAILAELVKVEKSIEPRYKIAIVQAQNMNSEGAASVITKYIDPMNLKSVAEIDKLLTIQRVAERKVISDSESADRVLMMLLIGLTLVTVAIGALISWRVTRSITGPLNQAVSLASTVAAGDLTSNINDQHRDEIGQLFDALRKMNVSLNAIIGNVRSTTDTIGSVSQQLAADNADLSSRTESQAGSLEETASAMEELTSTVRQNAENARQANQLVQSASSVATRGGRVVGDVVETMASIKDSSRKIVDIISVIDGIAFQTNILALNAAVEAARAGEQGRGFAVVATEVRNLAQRSASAAKEIKTLIGDSVNKVDSGSELVNQAGATMDEVVNSVKRVTDIMAEILSASEEQSAGIEEVNKAITEMDRVTQQNAVLVEEAASAAGTMQERASVLAEAVGVFRLSHTAITK
ncbi:methyl-accepting chemotaxis protein [Noviherbaspirillum saxi]|uniref:HAMP domain-containing protein n=1 Tax=Noviherbaspirillum saxi TaxID=2320863 RepID=A0A3A3FFG8_9BURK|nr:methyl-accepting chemotaxis protein [Noviherbaspirillum saxi]RJF92096.1 HAMP domain-containing protein [Noviherbaspirillum saxi]